MMAPTTTWHILGALLAMLCACLASCSDSGLSDAGAGSLGGKSKKEKDSQTSESGDDESAPADTPTQISGAFLACGKDTGERDPALPPMGEQEGCAVIDGATLTRKACEAFDQAKVTYTDGTQADVVSRPGPPTSFWHFRFVTPPGSTLDSVSMRAVCGGISESISSRTVSYVPPAKADGTTDFSSILIEEAANPSRKPDVGSDVPVDDAAPVAQPPSPAPTPPSNGPANYVIFVTSQSFSGNLGGRAGADQRCSAAAAAAGLPSAFRALISGPDASAARTFMNDRAIENMKGEVVIDQWAIWRGGIRRPIKYDEYGQPVPSGFVWTASDAFGRFEQIPASPTFVYASCGFWNVAQGNTGGGVGDPNAVDGNWIDTTGGFPCNAQMRLYCISR
jgi:hypothetical protein